MALFPAYANVSKAKEPEKTNNDSESWLSLSSFAIDVTPSLPSTSSAERDAPEDIGLIPSPPESAPGGPEPRRTKKHKKRSKHREATRKTIRKQENPVRPISKIWDDFEINVTRNREFLKVETISRPSAPQYRARFRMCHFKRFHKQGKLRRYFHLILDVADEKEEETKLTKKDLEKDPAAERNEHFTGFKQERDMSETTANYNRSVNENPHDIEMWLRYVQHQDDVFQFEKSYRKGTLIKGLRVTAERKLAIIDKALAYNPTSERLMRERLNVAVSAYPADELQTLLKRLVEKEPGNIIWWQGYIEATQCSMSHCNTPAVLKLYTRCLSTLHHLRRNSAVEKSHLEECILRMLYQCGLFMKQSGLFEQLWTLLRLYLELNLSPSDKNKFNIDSGFKEKQLMELEEVVLLSQLPIHELWLRIERLRESCHWLPYIESDSCEDPQRIVFPEDVAELIHPITMPGNTFKLTATILTLLKIPLLPCRHTTIQVLGLDYVPWALDSVELLLPMFLPIYPVDLVNKNLIKETQRMAVGPQYLKTFPAQEEYLDFLLATMKNCIDCLYGKEKTALTVWWFSFQRLLIVLDNEERYKMSAAFKKKIKSSMKQLLKENRNSVVFYQSYALVEYEMGNFDSAINILITALSMTAEGKNVSTLQDEEERSTICTLYKTLVELHLKNQTDVETNRQKALKYLVALALGKSVSTTDSLTPGSISEAELKFKHVTLQLLQKEVATLMTEDHFLPNFLTDWIICNGWFLYLTKGAIECGVLVEETLASLEAPTWQKEILFEFYVCVLFKNCQEKPGSGMFKLLDDVLYRAIQSFPNNLFLLSVLAKEQTLNCALGQAWWKLSSLLLKTGHAIPGLFLILIANLRSTEVEENWIDTITGKSMTESTNLTNRMVSIFRRLTSPQICTRRCGLVWRLYLQFLHANFDPALCRKAYYRAVEECPWLKALYIDAAIYIPAELAQIQDLLIEKQLRLHITPEELDVLRS